MTVQDLILANSPEVAFQGSTLGRAAGVHRWVMGALAASAVDPEYDAKVHSMSPQEIWDEVLSVRRCGFHCGGMSIFFQKCLALFGIDSILVGCGPDGATHVTVAVPADGKFYVFDPMFGLTYRESGTRAALDLESVLTGSVYEANCIKPYPVVLTPAANVAMRKQRWADREVTAIWEDTPNQFGLVAAHIVSFARPYRLMIERDSLAALGIAEDAEIVSELIAKRVRSYTGPSKIEEFGAMLARAGVPVG